jgi:hypothetical protein
MPTDVPFPSPVTVQPAIVTGTLTFSRERAASAAFESPRMFKLDKTMEPVVIENECRAANSRTASSPDNATGDVIVMGVLLLMMLVPESAVVVVFGEMGCKDAHPTINSKAATINANLRIVEVGLCGVVIMCFPSRLQV